MSSAVWKLFSRVDKASEKASCNSCGKEHVCKGGTTSNLINHLKSKHKELFEQYLEETKAKATPARRRPADEQIQAKMKQINFMIVFQSLMMLLIELLKMLSLTSLLTQVWPSML